VSQAQKVRKLERIEKRMVNVLEDLELLKKLDGNDQKVKQLYEHAVAMKELIG